MLFNSFLFLTALPFVQGKQARLKMIEYFCEAGDGMLTSLDSDDDVEHVARQFSIEDQQFKHGLPIYAEKQEFLNLLQSSQCVVLQAGTGTGDSLICCRNVSRQSALVGASSRQCTAFLGDGQAVIGLAHHVAQLTHHHKQHPAPSIRCNRH